MVELAVGAVLGAVIVYQRLTIASIIEQKQPKPLPDPVHDSIQELIRQAAYRIERMSKKAIRTTYCTDRESYYKIIRQDQETVKELVATLATHEASKKASEDKLIGP